MNEAILLQALAMDELGFRTSSSSSSSASSSPSGHVPPRSHSHKPRTPPLTSDSSSGRGGCGGEGPRPDGAEPPPPRPHGARAGETLMRRSLGGKKLEIVLCYIIYIAYSFQCIFYKRANSHSIHINHIKIWISLCSVCVELFELPGIFHKYIFFFFLWKPQKKKKKTPEKWFKKDKQRKTIRGEKTLMETSAHRSFSHHHKSDVPPQEGSADTSSKPPSHLTSGSMALGSLARTAAPSPPYFPPSAAAGERGWRGRGLPQGCLSFSLPLFPAAG